jgi:hypothetical protein
MSSHALYGVSQWVCVSHCHTYTLISVIVFQDRHFEGCAHQGTLPCELRTTRICVGITEGCDKCTVLPYIWLHVMGPMMHDYIPNSLIISIRCMGGLLPYVTTPHHRAPCRIDTVGTVRILQERYTVSSVPVRYTIHKMPRISQGGVRARGN